MSTTESNSGRKYQNQEWLNEQYHGEERTQAEIGTECGVSRTTIRRWMGKFDIETRRRGRPQIERAKFRTQEKGYERWRAIGGGTQYSVQVHRLLATLLVDDLSEMKDMDVHHRTHIPWLNTLDGIELLDREDHRQHHAGDGEPEVPE